MKTVGKFLREGRSVANVSVKELSKLTKIKSEFIDSLEEGSWEKLPDLPVLTGFVKSICDYVNLNKEQGVALLRRDYTPRKIEINPSPIIRRELRFGSRAVFFIVGAIFLAVMGAYLVYEYMVFTSAPILSVLSPADNELVATSKVTVRGTTDPSATITVNGQPALPDVEGNFVVEVEVAAETKTVEVKATSRSGREALVSRIIKVSLPK